MKTKRAILKMYITPIMMYVEVSWAPYSTKGQSKHNKVVQTIGLVTITGLPLPTYVKNKILLRSSNMVEVQENIILQSRAMFYRNMFPYLHLRNLSQQPSEDMTVKKIKPHTLQ